MGHLDSILWILLAWFTVHMLRAQLVSKKRKLPPGPLALPIIGNLYQLKYIFQVESNSHRSFAILAKTYGPLMKLQFGKLTTIVISSTDVAREALQKNDISFSNRYLLDVMTAIDHHKDSVVWLPVSPQWRRLRKISNSQVFTRSRLDASRHLRHDKVEGLLSHVRMCSQKGDPVNIGQVAFITSLNLLSGCFFSKDLAGYGTKEACELKDIIWNIALQAETPNIVDVFPVLSPIDPHKNRNHMSVHFEKMKNIFISMIDERLSSRVNGTPESNDVLDVLLKISESDGEELEREQTPHLLMDLFIAGTDTASRTLICAMAELLHNPKKLTKAQEELEQALGKGNAVKEEDMVKLPYLQSIIKETLRLHPALPLLLPRKVEVDTQLWGYTVPKNSQVLVNAWAIGRDPKVWEKPDSFEPERFIGSEIDVKGQHFELIPFGAGRRICPGFPLVLRTLPLMLGSLIHEFDWELVNKTKLGSIEIDDFSTFFAHKPFLAIPIPK